MILRDATIKYSGIDPNLLKPQSNKRICCSCEICGRVRWVFKYNYRDLCLSCSLSDKLNPFYGKKHSKESKVKMRDSHIGIQANEKSPMWGKCRSEKTRQKLSEANLGKSHTKDTKIKMSCKHQGISRNEWDGFISYDKYCSLFNNKFKELIRNRDHRICYLCGKPEGERNLDVHHVNYNKSCLCNSTCEFVPLCRSCHSKTNGNRSYWEDLIMNYLYPNRYFMVEV